MARALPDLKLVYVMRHPVDRLVSHYLHETTTGRITSGIEEAVDRHPELIDYGRYSMQLEPYLDAYGPANVLPVFFPRLVNSPRAELERIGGFLGLADRPEWDDTLKPQNVGAERLRNSVVRNALVRAPVLTPLRQRLIPRQWVEPVKTIWRTRRRAPVLGGELSARLRGVFDEDLARLGGWLGIDLNCGKFGPETEGRPHAWSARV